MANKMDKIKNYNQILLAVAGTLAIIFVIVSGGLVLLYELGGFFTTNQSQDFGLVERSENKYSSGDSLQKQIISFNKIELIDSLTKTYLLPVSHANLKNPEAKRGLSSLKVGWDSYEKYPAHLYNNVLIYSTLEESRTVVFDERVSITNFILHEEEKRKYLLIEVINSDSNGDEVINTNDLQELFVYDLTDLKLIKVNGVENYTSLRSFTMEKSNDLIVHLGIDSNKDGRFDASQEPKLFYKVDLPQVSLIPFVNTEEAERLQELLD